MENLINSETLAMLFNFEGPRRIQQLTKDGIIDAVEVIDNGHTVNRYDLLPTVKQYIKYLQDKVVNKTPDTPETIAADIRKLKADADWKEAKASIEKIKLAEIEGKMHRSDDVEAVLTEIALEIRNLISALPSRLAVDTAKLTTAEEETVRIKQECDIILAELANYKYDPDKFKTRVRARGVEEDAEESNQESD